MPSLLRLLSCTSSSLAIRQVQMLIGFASRVLCHSQQNLHQPPFYPPFAPISSRSYVCDYFGARATQVRMAANLSARDLRSLPRLSAWWIAVQAGGEDGVSYSICGSRAGRQDPWTSCLPRFRAQHGSLVRRPTTFSLRKEIRRLTSGVLLIYHRSKARQEGHQEDRSIAGVSFICDRQSPQRAVHKSSGKLLPGRPYRISLCSGPRAWKKTIVA